MDAAVATMSAASADLLAAIVPFDRERRWKQDGATCMSAWLAARYDETRSTTREWVRVAWALDDLPQISRTYRAARLSWSQVRFVSRFATFEDDAEWAERAQAMPPAELLYEAERRERVRGRDVHEAHRRRGVSTWWEEDGSVLNLHGRFGPDQGAVVERALLRLAERVPKDEDAERPGEARTADALVEAVTGGGAGRAPVNLVVHADVSVLAGEEQDAPALAETETGRRLSPETVRRLGCGADVEFVLEQDGRPVGIGRRGRVPPAWLRRLVVHRDRGRCRFPGCEGERWVDTHHIHHWTDGGRTDLDNLVLLCDAHHRLIHEGGWRIGGHPAWVLRFHDPGGRALLPPDLQPELLASGVP